MDSALKAVEIKELRPIRDRVIVSEMKFTDRFTKGGIYIPSDDKQIHGVRPRWGKVFAIGPEQKDVRVGQWILIAHGRWTRGVKIEDETGSHMLRMVDNNDILLSSDTEVVDEVLGVPLSQAQMNGAPRY